MPPGTTSNLNKNKLGIDKWENGELNTISLEPHVNEKLLSASWVVQDKQKPARAGGEAANEKIDLETADMAYLIINYSTRLNSLSHFFTYLALGLGTAAFVYCLILSRRVGKFKK